MTAKVARAPKMKLSWKIPGGTGWLVLPAAFFAIAFVGIPFIGTLASSLSSNEGFTFERYISFFSNSGDLGILGTTFITSIIVAIVTLIVAFPIALYLTLTRDRGRRYVLVVILSPLLISVVVRAYAFTVLLGPGNPYDRIVGSPYASLVDTQIAVVIGLVYVYITFMLLPIMNSLNSIDPRIMDAARTLGARTVSVLGRVIIPLTLPGITAGFLIVFMLSATSFILPIMLGGSGYKMMASLVYEQVFSLFDWPSAYTLGVILVVVSGVVLAVIRLLTGRTAQPPIQ